MCVLCSRQVVIFYICSHLWKTQYARFLVISFIVILGSLHLMRAIARAYASTRATSLKGVKL